MSLKEHSSGKHTNLQKHNVGTLEIVEVQEERREEVKERREGEPGERGGEAEGKEGGEERVRERKRGKIQVCNQLRCKSQFCPRPTAESWVDCLTPLSFRFLI